MYARKPALFRYQHDEDTVYTIGSRGRKITLKQFNLNTPKIDVPHTTLPTCPTSVGGARRF